MKTAHYFGAGKNKQVIIADGVKPIGQAFKVSGKREARQIAEQHNAQPWNF